MKNITHNTWWHHSSGDKKSHKEKGQRQPLVWLVLLLYSTLLATLTQAETTTLDYAYAPINDLSFDGVDDYYVLESTDVLDFSGDFSIVALVKADTAGDHPRLMDFFTTDQQDDVFIALSSGGATAPIFCIHQSSTDSDCIVSDQDADLGVWSQVAVSYDHPGTGTVGTAKMYVNGELVATDTSMRKPTFAAATTQWIGKSAWTNDDMFEGSVTELQFYNRVIAETELKNPQAAISLSNTESAPITDFAFDDVLSFNGITDYYDLADDPINVQGSWSVSAQVKVDSVGNHQRLFNVFTTSQTDDVYIALSDNDSLTPSFCIRHSDSDADCAVADAALPLGEWADLTITYNPVSKIGKIYIDGAQVGQNTSMDNPLASTGTTQWLGKSNWSDDALLDGAIKNFKFVTNELSATAILESYRNNTGLVFDGDNDATPIIDSSALDVSDDFSVEAWVYMDNLQNWARLFDFYTYSEDDNIFLAATQGTTGYPQFSFLNSGVKTHVSSSQAFPTNEWAHLAATYDDSATTAAIYINGSLVGENTNMELVDKMVRSTRFLGKSGWDADALFDGKMYDVRFWDTARTATEISSNLTTRFTRTEPNLTAHYLQHANLHPIEVDTFTKSSDHKAVIITGLPAGITVNGHAAAPEPMETVGYSQIVDVDALLDGDLKLHIPDGYFGEFSIRVTSYAGVMGSDYTLTSLTKTVLGQLTYSIAPEPDIDFLYAETGAISAYDPKNTELGVLCPKLDFSNESEESPVLRVVVTGVPTGAELYLADGVTEPNTVYWDNILASLLEWDTAPSVDHNLILDLGDLAQGSTVDLQLGQSRFIMPEVDDMDLTYRVEYPCFVNEQLLAAQPIPLNIVVNPLLDSSATVTLTDIDAGAVLYGKDGNALSVSGGSITLSAAQYEGLNIDVGSVSEAFTVNATLQASYAGQSYTVSNSMFVPVPDLTFAYDRSGTVINFAGAQDDYEIRRFGNTLEVVLKSNRTEVQRVSMVEIDHLRFLEPVSYVSSSDFYTEVDISSSVSLTDSNNNKILFIGGLPEGVAINNAVPIGNGQYLIPVADIIDNKIEFDSILRGTDYSESVSVGVYLATEVQYEYVSGAARIAGYANAVMMAEAGTGFSARMDGSGVSLEMGAYAKAMQVATAGGSIEFSEYLRSTVAVAATNTQEVSVNVGVTATDKAVASRLQANAEAVSDVSATLEIGSEMLHTRITSKQSAGVRIYARAKGSNGMYYGDGKYGSDGELELGAGAQVDAGGVGTVKVIGVSSTGGVRVSAGLTAGASGRYTGVYEDGKVDIGMSASGKLLVGGKVNLNLTIDTNETADSAVLIGNNTVTISYAIANSLTSVENALEEGLISGVNAINYGFISTADAYATGYITLSEKVAIELLAEIEDDLSKAAAKEAAAIVDAAEQAAAAVNAARKAIEDGLDYADPRNYL